MDRGEKVAYYCSELGSRSNDSQTQAKNNNNNIVIGQPDSQDQKQEEQMQQQQLEGQSTTSSGDYPSRLINRFNNPQADQQQQPGPADQHLTRPFAQNQILSNTQQQQQYLISSSNSQHLTNLTSHNFNHNNNNNNNGPFPNQLPHNASYHINSNHHLYQASLQQQQQQQLQNQARTSIFHHKTPSSGEDAHNNNQPQNQVIFHDNNKHLAGGDAEMMQRRQMAHQYEQSNLVSSQSMNQTDFNRIRRKPEHIALTSEVGLESLNLDFEAMLMNGGQNFGKNNNNINQVAQKQHQNSGQNVDKLLRTLVNQQSNDTERPNNGNDMSSNSGYGERPGQQQDAARSNKDSLYMVYNRSEDNIYEEIDSMTMTRLRAEYQFDTISLHSDTWKKKNAKKFLSASFTRWFSTRKKSSNSQNSDQDENPYIDSKSIKRPRLISLPDTVPENLTPEKLKRRLIVGSIVESENSYTNSLYRLIYEYKKPLEESDPPILSANKIGIIFFCLDQILQFHKLFGLALSHHVQEWDEKEMIGSVFTTSFSKPMVFEIYSGFINNFTNAMETARRASKSKAFAQFLQDKSTTSPDRLSFFGSMVKPVQRFPQFILLISDLLKHTPFNHPDRMPLQRALTELESLADRLNERKRDAERHFAVKQLLKDHLNESNAHSQRFLLRQDDTCLLDMDLSTNTILKSKTRKMYLLNDMLICVSTPSNRLKFAVPLSDITVIESITPAISNLLAHSNFNNLNENPSLQLPLQNYTIERMECERQSLVHDLKLMMDISTLVTSLRFQYNGLNPAVPEQICMGIRDEIRKKEFQMTLIDRSCLQLYINSKNHKDTLVVQFSTPESKREWLIDVRLTKLALDRANNPGWENVTDNPPPAHQASLCSIGQRVPLFVSSFAIFQSDHQSHLTCALHYYLRQAPFIGENPAGVLWICNVTVGASKLGALATNGAEIQLIHSYELADSHVTCLESAGPQVWIGLQEGRIIVIDANSPSEWKQFASLDVKSEVTCIKYFGPFVYVGLASGYVAVFDPMTCDNPLLIQLSQSPVTCLMPINDELFACSHHSIWRIKDNQKVDSLTVNNDNLLPLEEGPRPNLLAHCGNGIWVSLIDSPIVKLYHAESLKHLVDINVGNSIRRVLNDFKEEIKITVTSMMATRGLLWIGTNVGMIATLTLPRLQGVPLVSGSINVALHRFLGPVNILLNLSAGSECIPQLPFSNRNSQQMKPNQVMKNEDAEAIYGQYADLMNVGDYITSGRKSGSLGDAQAERVGWEFPNANISTMNISDDSGSNASSGAIYQDGMPRGMKQVQNKAVVANVSNMIQKLVGQQQSVQNQLITNNLGQQAMQPGQINVPNHVYDKAPSQSVTYNQGSLNGAHPPMPQNMSESTSLERLQQLQALTASQPHLAKVDLANSHSDYGSQSGKLPSRLYDQPAQLIQQQQQQQIIQQSRQAATNQAVDGTAMGMQAPMPNYGTVGLKTKTFSGNKTVLVLAGGNGYQRMALGDENKPYGEHAHGIIWEYKA